MCCELLFLFEVVAFVLGFLLRSGFSTGVWLRMPLNALQWGYVAFCAFLCGDWSWVLGWICVALRGVQCVLRRLSFLVFILRLGVICCVVLSLTVAF